MTNGDRIRAMTDEELAEWFVYITYMGEYINDAFRKTTEYTWSKWLRQTAEDKENGINSD